MKRVSWLLERLPALILLFVVGAVSYSVVADSVTTQVTVANTAPGFTLGPLEDPTSDTTTPTGPGEKSLLVVLGARNFSFQHLLT